MYIYVYNSRYKYTCHEGNIVTMLKDFKIDKSAYEPIYIQIARKIRKQILAGKLLDGTQLPPEHKMAELFGANRLTLRKSLKQLAAQRLVVQKKGRGTFVTYGPQKKYRIGLNFSVEGTSRDSFGLQVLNGLVYALQNSLGSELVLLNTDKQENSSIMQAYNELNCDGLVIVGTNNKDVEEICSADFDKIPTVILCADKKMSKSTERVWIDTSEGAVRQAIEHLVELGHSKTLFLSTTPDTPNLQKRNAEYRQVIKDLGIAESSEIIEIANVDSWYDAARDIMLKKCTEKDYPTAVICSGRVFAYGAWQGIMEAGLKIPDDISIIGIGCEEDANPHLSTINVDVLKMAKLAGKTMINLLEHRNVDNKHIYFESILIDRDSCKKLSTLNN